MSSLTIAEFEAMIAEAYDLDDEIEKYKRDVLKPMEAKLGELERKILAQLEEEEKTSYKSNRGTVVRMRRYSVTVPKDPADKEKLFNWLRGKGDNVYWQYATVNSQSLNSLYKAEMERAKEEGDFDFNIPGLGQPIMSESLAKRSK